MGERRHALVYRSILEHPPRTALQARLGKLPVAVVAELFRFPPRWCHDRERIHGSTVLHLLSAPLHRLQRDSICSMRWAEPTARASGRAEPRRQERETAGTSWTASIVE